MPGPSLGFYLTPSGLGVGLHFDAGGTTVAPVVPSDARRAPTVGFDSTASGLEVVLHFDAGGTAVAPVVPSDTCRALL